PLIMGGELTNLDAFSLKLITDPDVIACNQNGVMGRLVHEGDGLEVWFTPEKNSPQHGWFGVFNRTAHSRDVTLTAALLGLAGDAEVTDIWNGHRNLAPGTAVTISDNGALFLRLP
ncbi:MAG: hypothetical protein JWQ83_301, partial [Lacunisphaera sp.]|nr:hypothetical protein [Lacunisphaera sp.]